MHMRPVLETYDAKLDGFGPSTAARIITEVASDLRSRRDRSDPAEWRAFVEAHRGAHPLFDRMRQGPVTGRSYRKPRGYAGDAETLDLIYGHGLERSRWSTEVKRIYDWERSAPAAQAVRDRARSLGAIIDEVAAHRGEARAMSVACGHLREAGHARTVREGTFGTLHAIDQDRQSLEVVRRSHPESVVRTRQASVRHLLGRRIAAGELDLIWSAGLYDYLEVPVARALTQRLFQMLASGGRLVLVNFAPELPDIGYMEAVMAWDLIYRSEDEMRELTRGLDREQVSGIRTWRESDGNLVWLEVRKR